MTQLPRWTSVVEGASFVPCCDLCGWIGKDQWTMAAARKACRDHARGKSHREDADAHQRAVLRDQRRRALAPDNP